MGPRLKMTRTGLFFAKPAVREPLLVTVPQTWPHPFLGLPA